MAQHSKTFALHGGKSFSDLKQFAKELQKMDTKSFKHHVNDTKNDFANWVKHSLGHEKLAEKLQKRVDKVETELEVLRHMVFEEQKKKASTKKTTTKSKK